MGDVMIYIDIDDTVRDLFTPIEKKYGIKREQWEDWDTKINGKGFCSFIDKDMSENAPLTSFGMALQKELCAKREPLLYWNAEERHDVKFLSGAIHAKETTYWLSKHFGLPNRANGNVIFVEKSEDKYQYLKDCDWFIDDCPKLGLYPDLKWKWICIPQLYNVGVKCYRRTDDINEIRSIINDSTGNNSV
jgi:uncharacterized protein YifE (UPF0438 family)